MNLSQARQTTRRRLKSGNDSSRYAEIDLDDGILTVTNRFVLDTRCVKSSDEITITADDEAADFFDLPGTSLAGFRSDFIVDLAVIQSASYSDADVQAGIDIVDPTEIRERKVTVGTTHGTPTMASFTTHTDAILWPKPKANGSLRLLWTPPATTWTPGVGQVTAVLTGTGVSSITIQNAGTYLTAPAVTFVGGGGTGAAATAAVADGQLTGFSSFTAGTGYTSAPTVYLDGVSAGAITLNIPDDLLEPLITFAARLVPQLTEPEAMNVITADQLWKDHVASARGRGSLGVKSHITRSNAAIRGGW